MMQDNFESEAVFGVIVPRLYAVLGGYCEYITRRYYALVNLFRRSYIATQLRSLTQQHTQLPLSGVDQVLLEMIQHYGVATGHLNDLQLEITSDMWQAAQMLMLAAPSVGKQKKQHDWDSSEHCIFSNAVRIATKYPEIILWGLNERLLDILANHMRCPPALVSVSIRKEIPDGRQVGTRLWHVDQYDRSVLKVFVYLNDVEQLAGPFEYVPKTCHTPKQRFLTFMWLSFRHKFRENSGFEKLIPSTDWCSVIGPAGSTIIADTSAIFHHGAVPTHGERVVLVYTYTTQRPTKRSLRKGLFPETILLPSLLSRLSPRQQDALLGWKSKLSDEVQN